MNALIVEDDLISAAYLSEIVEEVGIHVVEMATSAKDAYHLFFSLKPDLLLVDIALEGDESGCDLALRIRETGWEGVMVFLTAYYDDGTIECARAAGASGYLLKPYRPDEIRAMLQLCCGTIKNTTFPKSQDTQMHLKGGYVYDTVSETLMRQGQTVWLRKKEQELLNILCAYPQKVFYHEELIELLWEEGSLHDLRTLVYRLRKATHKHIVLNVRRSGYQIGSE